MNGWRRWIFWSIATTAAAAAGDELLKEEAG